MSDVKVLPVPEGSIIWLHDIAGAAPHSEEEFVLQERLMDGLRKKIGHDRYVVLATEGDGIVDVLGPDELVERVRAALAEAGIT